MASPYLRPPWMPREVLSWSLDLRSSRREVRPFDQVVWQELVLCAEMMSKGLTIRRETSIWFGPHDRFPPPGLEGRFDPAKTDEERQEEALWFVLRNLFPESQIVLGR
jgi:hypothetical protein